MAVTRDQLAYAVKVKTGEDIPTDDRLDNLLAAVEAQVDARTSGLTVPVAVSDEATIRYGSYLWEDSTRNNDQLLNFAAGWVYSGAAALVNPYRRRRARTT